MSTEENRANVRRSIEEGWNQGNVAVYDELCAPDFLYHDPAVPHVRTREDFKQWVPAIRSAFPDLHITIEDMIAEGDQVVVRYMWRGTNTGDVTPTRRIPATGKQVTVTGISIARVASGKAVEVWNEADNLGLLQQLGVVPTPGQPE